MSAITSLVSASGSHASATVHRLCPGWTTTLVTYLPTEAALPSARVAWAVVASPTDAAPMSSADMAVTTIRPRRVRRTGPADGRAPSVRIRPPAGRSGFAVMAVMGLPTCIVTMSAPLIKRPFDGTPVRSLCSSIERRYTIFVPRGSDIFATRRTDVW